MPHPFPYRKDLRRSDAIHFHTGKISSKTTKMEVQLKVELPFFVLQFFLPTCLPVLTPLFHARELCAAGRDHFSPVRKDNAVCVKHL